MLFYGQVVEADPRFAVLHARELLLYLLLVVARAFYDFPEGDPLFVFYLLITVHVDRLEELLRVQLGEFCPVLLSLADFDRVRPVLVE